jgi:hypothetical protein
MVKEREAYSQSDVSGNTFIESVFAKDSKCRRKSTFQIRALFVRILKLGRPRKSRHLAFGRGLVESRLMWCNARWLGGVIGNGGCC